jgi:AbrB family looped-hinge helix DNA binding protein
MNRNKDSILAVVRIKEKSQETAMAKVTSKFQVTVPKKIADKYNIRPGDEIEWVAAGEVIRVIPPGENVVPEDLESRLHLFDLATERHCKRSGARKTQPPKGRGWRREDLSTRGRSR